GPTVAHHSPPQPERAACRSVARAGNRCAARSNRNPVFAKRASSPRSGVCLRKEEPPMRVFEIRTYTAAEGKLDALQARFRDHTMELFNKHDMTSVAYFTPQDPQLKQRTLIYILAHPSR